VLESEKTKRVGAREVAGGKVGLAVGAGVVVGGSRDASLHVVEVHSWRSTCNAALVFSSVVAVAVTGVRLVNCA